MRSIANVLLAALIVPGVVYCGPHDSAAQDRNATTIAPQKAERMPRDVPPPRARIKEAAPCPGHLIGYCRGWEVFEASPVIRPNPHEPDDLGHIDFGDKIVIGTLSQNQDPDLWLFARPQPENRWGTKKIRLYEISTNNAHDCLAGKIRLPNHSDPNGPHDWHQVTLRLEGVPESEIGNENNLAMCFTPVGDGSRPTECEAVHCPDLDDPLLHGGVAHAQD